MKIKGILKKEIMDGARNYRFLILCVGFLFFAILDPVMSKLILPGVLKSQFPDMSEEVMKSMMDLSQVGNIRTYLGDVFEIGMLVLIFTLSGIVAQEISERTLILPVCTGKRYGNLIMGKLVVYGTVLVAATTLAALVNYVYSGVLFGFQLSSPMPVIRAGLLQGLYMIFVLSMLMMIGAFVKKPIVTGMLTLIPAYGTRFLGDLLHINTYLPSGLLSEGELMAVVPSTAVLESIICTLAILVLAVGITMIRLSKMELMRG